MLSKSLCTVTPTRPRLPSRKAPNLSPFSDSSMAFLALNGMPQNCQPHPLLFPLGLTLDASHHLSLNLPKEGSVIQVEGPDRASVSKMRPRAIFSNFKLSWQTSTFTWLPKGQPSVDVLHYPYTRTKAHGQHRWCQVGGPFTFYSKILPTDLLLKGQIRVPCRGQTKKIEAADQVISAEADDLVVLQHHWCKSGRTT